MRKVKPQISRGSEDLIGIEDPSFLDDLTDKKLDFVFFFKQF